MSVNFQSRLQFAYFLKLFLAAEWELFVFPPLHLPTTGEHCCHGNVCFLHEAFSRDSGAERGEAAWMISSLQQLHSAARQTRNFLSNFQVVFESETLGHFRFRQGANTFSREGEEERCAVCVSDLWDLVTSWTKGRKTAAYCVTSTTLEVEKQTRWVGSMVVVMCGVLFVVQHLSAVWKGQSRSLCCVKLQWGASV